MQIKKLFLQNFRNYEAENFDFTEGLNVLFGKNAQGKTNCAEAVFYLCTGTSLRIRHDKQLIRMGAENAYIRAEAENRYGKVTIEATRRGPLKGCCADREFYCNGATPYNRQARFGKWICS